MKWTYRPALDGLRSMATYIIILFHAGVAWVPGGFIPLDLFFVLSGYLVTNVILSEIDRNGKLDLGRFYARRVRRLLPAAVVTIVATTLIFLLVTSVVRRIPLIGDAQAALLYVANWRFIIEGTDYFADESVSPFLHFWSLAVEEQFYFVFPLVVIALVKSKARWALPAGLAAIFLCSLAAQVYWGQVNEVHAYYGTDARLYQLVAGALLAVAMRSPRFPVARSWGAPVAVAGLASFALLVGPWLDLSQSNRGIVATVACTMLVGGLMVDEGQALGKVFGSRVMVYLGTITYAIYLWHWPITVLLEEFLATRPEVIAVLVAVLATAMAAASAELLEMPIRTTKLLDPHRWKVVVVGVAASALIAVTFIPWSLSKDRQPSLAANVQTGPANGVDAVTAEAAADEAEEMPAQIDWRAIRDDKGKELKCLPDAGIDRCRLVEGSGAHVLVIGDSHARMLLPMFERIAQEQDLALSANVQANCMWQPDLLSLEAAGGRKRAESCAEIRVGWLEEMLPLMRPDVVVLIGEDRLEARVGPLRTRDGSRRDIVRVYKQSIRETVALIAEEGAQVVLVEDLITPDDFEPAECLATASTPADCAVPLTVDTPPTTGLYLAEAFESSAVTAVNLNAAFCPSAPLCQPIVDGAVVWRDRYHLTTDYAVERRDEVWKLLQGTGAFD